MMRIQKITIAYFVSLYILYRFTELSVWFYICMTLCYFIIPAMGSLIIQSNFYLQAISKIKTDKKSIVLSFNLYEKPSHLDQLLEIFDHNNFKAVFFCSGALAQQQPDIIEQLHDAGHSIANMAWDNNKNFGFLSSTKLQQQIQDTETQIMGLTQTAAPMFRPPRGITNPAVATATKRVGYSVIGWSKRLSNKSAQSKESLAREVAKVQSGDIIFIDISLKQNIKAIQTILDSLSKKGLSTITEIPLPTTNKTQSTLDPKS